MEKEKDSITKVPIIKALDEKLMQATFVVMVPSEVDLHGDITSELEVLKACHNFNKFCRKGNLFHVAQTETFDIAESYIVPVDIFIGDKFVKKGTWLAVVQANDPNLWALIENGTINGLSIGCHAIVEDI